MCCVAIWQCLVRLLGDVWHKDMLVGCAMRLFVMCTMILVICLIWICGTTLLGNLWCEDVGIC